MHKTACSSYSKNNKYLPFLIKKKPLGIKTGFSYWTTCDIFTWAIGNKQVLQFISIAQELESLFWSGKSVVLKSHHGREDQALHSRSGQLRHLKWSRERLVYSYLYRIWANLSWMNFECIGTIYMYLFSSFSFLP